MEKNRSGVKQAALLAQHAHQQKKERLQQAAELSACALKYARARVQAKKMGFSFVPHLLLKPCRCRAGSPELLGLRPGPLRCLAALRCTTGKKESNYHPTARAEPTPKRPASLCLQLFSLRFERLRPWGGAAGLCHLREQVPGLLQALRLSCDTEGAGGFVISARVVLNYTSLDSTPSMLRCTSHV